MIRLLALVLMSIASAAFAAEQAQTVPPRFQGAWNTNLKHCGTALDDSRLIISANRIKFYESGGPIRAVVTRGQFDLALIVELSGEGETWLSYSYFRLSSDHASITSINEGEPGMVRYRCPRGAK